MPIERRWPTMNLQPVDELICMRKEQHGGQRGAPKKLDSGERVGAALNKSAILMLSALLQGYAEGIFMAASLMLFSEIKDPRAQNKYRDSFRRTGNPNSKNITELFVRIGIVDVFDGLGWTKTDPVQVKSRLKAINELRNKIAHGKPLPSTISLKEVIQLRNFVEQFGNHFANHVRGKLG